MAGPAFGVTEDGAGLLAAPQGSADAGGPRVAHARELLASLHPSYVRLLVDWASLQPNALVAPRLEATVDGCAREVAPCAPYRGIAGEFAALAERQGAARAEGEAAFQVVLDVFGVPAWAAAAPAGCEAPKAAFARALTARGLAGYRELIGALLALGAREGVALQWWSPWNEPNNASFLAPQLASCKAGAPLRADALYAQLARAMASELASVGGTHHLLLGELAGAAGDSPRRTSISSFVAALPEDVVCLSETWAVHDYASFGDAGESFEPVGALERALERRGRCGREARIWVTESGAGAPHAGAPRPDGAGGEGESCRALAIQLRRWVGDPRVASVMQYSFREDPAYPVGLVSADLSHVYPTYRLWLRYTRARGRDQPLPPPTSLCA